MTTRLPLILSFALLGGCAIAPVKISLRKHAPPDDLHTLLEKALARPETPQSKEALARFVSLWRENSMGDSGVVTSSIRADAPVHQVSFSSARPGTYPPTYFDRLLPASDFRIGKLAHHRQDGAGAPLMALRENHPREALERFYPPEAITRPATAVVTRVRNARPGRKEVRIELACPLRHEQGIAGSGPLAADYSVPWAALLARTGKLKQSEVADFLARTPSREPRLYLMEPYDPRKEPLIMIHGLLSSSLVWATLSNELWADPEVRRRYQIWHYQYHTSAPALYSARLLRQQLRELRPLLDPEGDDPAMQRTTLVAHSMGGLVSKALAVNPGDAFWKAAFTVPPEKLKLSDADRAALTEAFSWKPDPSVRRIIFIAVPHLGSDFADNPLGRIGSWLSAPPGGFKEFYWRISADNPGAFTPAYAALGSGRLDSVNALSPMQPTLGILAALPFPDHVRVHSIIGNRGKPGPLEASSDGVVPYTSSHLPGAASEKIIPEGHGCVSHPETMAEVRRILRE